MKRRWHFILTMLVTSTVLATDIGVVSFADCIARSKVGQAEQTKFETLKKQLGSYLETTEKELKDIASKLNDREYLDGLSPEAEAELKAKAQSLNEEMMRYQGQYYQTLNQTNSQIVQQLGAQVASASELVAKEQKLSIILNQEACFYRDDAVNVTDQVIHVLDELFDKKGE